MMQIYNLQKVYNKTLVRDIGLEPIRSLRAIDFKSIVSAYSTNPA